MAGEVIVVPNPDAQEVLDAAAHMKWASARYNNLLNEIAHKYAPDDPGARCDIEGAEVKVWPGMTPLIGRRL